MQGEAVSYGPDWVIHDEGSAPRLTNQDPQQPPNNGTLVPNALI